MGLFFAEVRGVCRKRQEDFLRKNNQENHQKLEVTHLKLKESTELWRKKNIRNSKCKQIDSQDQFLFQMWNDLEKALKQREKSICMTNHKDDYYQSDSVDSRNLNGFNCNIKSMNETLFHSVRFG